MSTVKNAAEATARAREIIHGAQAVLGNALHANALGVLLDPATALIAIETAQARLVEAVKIIASTEWPRDTDYE